MAYRADKYDKNFLTQNMMGPNSMIILEELLEAVPLKRGMRVLDLGCGNGLTSVFLAKEYGVQVFAVDLWISATDNYKRFESLGLSQPIIPIHADAEALPFADGFFDAVVSVDSYHYFGNNSTYFDQHLGKLLKPNGLVALAFPGMKGEILPHIPAEMAPFWPKEALPMWHSIDWWREVLPPQLAQVHITQMKCFDRAWGDWLQTENPYAIGDRAMMQADGGRYMNLISVTGVSQPSPPPGRDHR